MGIIVDGTLNPVPLCDLDQVVIKEGMAENRGLTLEDLKKRCPEHTSVTLTGHESSEDWEMPWEHESKPPVEDAEDRLTEIAGRREGSLQLS